MRGDGEGEREKGGFFGSAWCDAPNEGRPYYAPTLGVYPRAVLFVLKMLQLRQVFLLKNPFLSSPFRN